MSRCPIEFATQWVIVPMGPQLTEQRRNDAGIQWLTAWLTQRVHDSMGQWPNEAMAHSRNGSMSPWALEPATQSVIGSVSQCLNEQCFNDLMVHLIPGRFAQ